VVVFFAFAPEHIPDEDERHRDGERGAGDDDAERHRAFEHGVEQRFFGDEAEQRGQARHRQPRQHRHDRPTGHVTRQPAELRHVAGAGRVVDRACDEEQRRLVQAVRENADERRRQASAVRQADERDERPQLADGRIGERGFQVALAQRQHRADEHRQQARRP
jgi:hypothetical protein